MSHPRAPLLAVDGLSVEFRTDAGVVAAVNDVSWSVFRGEVLAILGESGAGKSVSVLAVLGLLDPTGRITAGRVTLDGQELTTPRSRARVRGRRIGMVFQDAIASLNPFYTVGWQLGEMYRVHRGLSRRRATRAAVELLDRVGVPSARERIHAYPHEFSGGMRQRVMIAMAIALEPDVLIADEPTTALDVTVQAQILRLLDDLRRQTGMGMVLITHDLGVVAEVADRVEVMYGGRIVERGAVGQVLARPAHPYTAGLLRSTSRVDQIHTRRLEPIRGAPPDPRALPPGCAFHPRCPLVVDRCRTQRPRLDPLPAQGRASACHFWEDVVAT